MDFAHGLQQADRLGPIMRVPPLGGERVNWMGPRDGLGNGCPGGRHRHHTAPVVRHVHVDLDKFESGGPDNSAAARFLRINPRRAVFMCYYGLHGKDEWRA